MRLPLLYGFVRIRYHAPEECRLMKSVSSFCGFDKGEGPKKTKGRSLLSCDKVKNGRIRI